MQDNEFILSDITADEKVKLIESDTSKHPAYSKIRRELSEEELKQTGTIKLIIADADKQEKEIIELKSFREKYYNAIREVSVLNERLNNNNRYEVLHTICIGFGGVICGLATSGTITLNSIILLIIGAFLIGFGAITKWGNKNGNFN